MAGRAGGAGVTILLVEDDASLRLLCRVNLEHEGYRVLEAERLDKAEELLSAEDVDVVLLDLHVAGEDARELLHRLRVERLRTPVALVTGESGLEPAVAAAADAVIQKPFTLDDLLGTVERLRDR
jgi:DNA-binding NtrC family response regulator